MPNRIPYLVFIALMALMLSRCKHPVKESNTSNNYYVSNKGDDNNSGTIGQPFKTIGKINSLNLKPGTTIFFKGGETYSGTLNLTLHGTEMKPIIITSYNSEKIEPIIDAGTNEGIHLSGSNFILRGFRVKGAGRTTGNTTNGITLSGVSNAMVHGIHVMGFQKSGIELNTCNNVIVGNIYAYDNGFCGIYVTGTKEKEQNISW